MAQSSGIVRMVNHFQKYINLKDINEQPSLPSNLILVESQSLKTTEEVATDLAAYGDISVFQFKDLKYIVNYAQGSTEDLIGRINTLQDYSATHYI